MSDLRNIPLNHLTLSQLAEFQAFLLDVIADEVKKDRAVVAKMPDDVKAMLAKHTPSAVNWNSAPELNAADVVAQAEALLL